MTSQNFDLRTGAGSPRRSGVLDGRIHLAIHATGCHHLLRTSVHLWFRTKRAALISICACVWDWTCRCRCISFLCIVSAHRQQQGLMPRVELGVISPFAKEARHGSDVSRMHASVPRGMCCGAGWRPVGPMPGVCMFLRIRSRRYVVFFQTDIAMLWNSVMVPVYATSRPTVFGSGPLRFQAKLLQRLSGRISSWNPCSVRNRSYTRPTI